MQRHEYQGYELIEYILSFKMKKLMPEYQPKLFGAVIGAGKNYLRF